MAEAVTSTVPRAGGAAAGKPRVTGTVQSRGRATAVGRVVAGAATTAHHPQMNWAATTGPSSRGSEDGEQVMQSDNDDDDDDDASELQDAEQDEEEYDSESDSDGIPVCLALPPSLG